RADAGWQRGRGLLLGRRSRRARLIGPLRPACPAGPRPPLPQPRRLRDAEVDPVEQELERAVRLRAERDLRAEEEELALAHLGLDDGGAALEVVLPPRPAAAQRLCRVEPRDAAH